MAAGHRDRASRWWSTASRRRSTRSPPGRPTSWSATGDPTRSARCATRSRRARWSSAPPFRPRPRSTTPARTLARPLFTAWLAQIDGSGAARPRYTWAPGRDEAPPVPARRLSAEWEDRAWRAGAPDEGLGRLDPDLAGDPLALAGGHAAAGRRDRAPLPCPWRRGRGGRPGGRRSARAAKRRHGHLRGQPQHQLHQPVLLPLRLLRLLARAQEPQPARRPLHPERARGGRTARSRPPSRGAPRSACRAASTPTSPATSTSSVLDGDQGSACPRCTCTASRRSRSGRGAQTLGVGGARVPHPPARRRPGDPPRHGRRDPRRPGARCTCARTRCARPSGPR